MEIFRQFQLRKESSFTEVVKRDNIALFNQDFLKNEQIGNLAQGTNEKRRITRV